MGGSGAPKGKLEGMNKQARILVVDDEKVLRDIVSRALAKLGHECVTAANGEEALALELVSMGLSPRHAPLLE